MHDRHVPPYTSASLALGVAASLALFVAPDPSCAASLDRPAPDRIAALRARGPAALEELLARYRREQATGTVSPDLEATIDAVAGQRYATYSGLYWYTDLELAKRAAHELHRPILALRMLGDLREDLSCANSRLFRTTLYANTEVSAFLRSHFVLYWSSERPVPRVTIEFGDGRKLVRTTTGNSAHYVLDADGNVVDVLPGLYAPSVFKGELEVSLALADRLRGMSNSDRIQATAAHHRAAVAASVRAWELLGDTRYIRGGHYLLGRGDLPSRSAIAAAQATTATKMAIEVPDLTRIGLIRGSDVPDDEAAWSAIGQKLWHIGDPSPADGDPARRTRRVPPPDAVPASIVLDASSRALIRRLYFAGPADRRVGEPELASVIARLEQHIVADTAINQHKVRKQIREFMSSGQTELAVLNPWIYDQVFATPQSDPWLGLHARTDFSGLPGDGAVMP